MIIKGQAIAAALRGQVPDYQAYLFYGRDNGRIRESATAMAHKVVTDLADPFRVAEFSGTQLRDDPALLSDEAAALSMTGGRRVVRVRGATDANVDAFRGFLENPCGDALIIAEAGDLNKNSKLRVLFEAARNAAAAACYEDTASELEDLIVAVLREHKLAISSDALAYLCGCLGEDRARTRQELEKLTLYKGNGENDRIREVEIADVLACIGDPGTQRLDDICYATFSGEIAALDAQMSAMFESGQNPVGILRAATGHALRLQLAVARIASGTAADSAVKSLRPPIHFTRTRAFRAQLQLWNVQRLSQTLTLLMDAERDCKTTGLPDIAICGRTLLRIATAAQSARMRHG